MISAAEALGRLERGNHDFVTVRAHERDLSPERVAELYAYGQSPFAVVVACSDSRTVPEHMFMMGLGDLFVIRVAGNVVGDVELASVVYACEHLGVKLVLVLGHTGCGAVQATMETLDAACAEGAAGHVQAGERRAEDAAAPDGQAAGGAGALSALVEPIGRAIGAERDPYRASELNVRAGMEKIAGSPDIARLVKSSGLEVHGAIYHTHSGEVDFLV